MFGFGAKHNIAMGSLNLELILEGSVSSQTFVKDSILKDQLVTELKYDKELIKEAFDKSERF